MDIEIVGIEIVDAVVDGGVTNLADISALTETINTTEENAMMGTSTIVGLTMPTINDVMIGRDMMDSGIDRSVTVSATGISAVDSGMEDRTGIATVQVIAGKVNVIHALTTTVTCNHSPRNRH